MALSYLNKPLVAQGWLRVVLFFICYIVVVSLATSVVMLFNIPGLTKTNAQNLAATMGKPPMVYIVITVTALISFLMVLLFRRVFDRQTVLSLGFSMHKNGANAIVGFFTGTVILCMGTLFLYVNKNLQWTDITVQPVDLFTGAVTMLIVSFAEELVFRGYILNNLLQSMNKWAALVLTSALFAIMHCTNPNITIISVLNIFIAGMLLGINYVYTQNLWYAILLHFSWNFLQGALFGYEVSGVILPSLLHQQLQGSELLTGGVFGFEGSVVATVLMTACFITYLFVYSKKYRALAAS